MKLRFKVYEIEHDGDLENATDEVEECGAENIEVEDTDFENSESATLVVEVKNVKEFKRKIREADLCL
jgi:hypothetical protein